MNSTRNELITLREFMESKLETMHVELAAHDARSRDRAGTSDKAIQLASEALTIRLDHSNGLLAMMQKLIADLATKESLSALDARVQSLELARERVEGSFAGGKPLRDLGMLVVGAIIAYVAGRLTRV